MYLVAGPSEMLAITGSRIKEIALKKKHFLWPHQRCTRLDISLVNYSFQVQAMSAEKLPFVLPSVFTIGPQLNQSQSLIKYAQFLSEAQKARADAELYARQQAANSELYAKKKEAEGVAEIGKAQAMYVGSILKELNYNYSAFRDYLMINSGIYKDIDQINLQGGSGLKDALPPLLQTVHDQIPHQSKSTPNNDLI